MFHRTFGETKNCKGCRYWSEMIAKCEGGGQVQAYCLTPNKSAPYALKYTFGLQSCSEWASGDDGAIDEPGSDPNRYDEQDDDEPGYCPHCAGSGEGSHDGAICGYCKCSGVKHDNSSREDWEAERADQRNDERKLAGEWE